MFSTCLCIYLRCAEASSKPSVREHALSHEVLQAPQAVFREQPLAGDPLQRSVAAALWPVGMRGPSHQTRFDLRIQPKAPSFVELQTQEVLQKGAQAMVKLLPSYKLPNHSLSTHTTTYIHVT